MSMEKSFDLCNHISEWISRETVMTSVLPRPPPGQARLVDFSPGL